MRTRQAEAARRLSPVIRAIEADLQRPWSVADMAAIVGVSSAQLRRLSACGLGASPRQLLCDLRLQAAARLLRDPTTRIKEIQARVGIADSSHFARDFRCRYGVSPTEFRSRLAESGDP